MNKVAAAVLAAAMVGSMAVPAFAVSQPSEGMNGVATSGNAKLTYEVSKSYTWTIHNDLTFSKKGNETNYTASGDVEVTKNVIGEGEKLKITVKGNNGGSDTNSVSSISAGDGFQILTGNSTKRTYTASSKVDENTTSVNTTTPEVLVVDAGNDTGKATVTYTLVNVTGTGKSEVSGTYTGYVIYSASVTSEGE